MVTFLLVRNPSSQGCFQPRVITAYPKDPSINRLLVRVSPVTCFKAALVSRAAWGQKAVLWDPHLFCAQGITLSPAHFWTKGPRVSGCIVPCDSTTRS